MKHLLQKPGRCIFSLAFIVITHLTSFGQGNPKFTGELIKIDSLGNAPKEFPFDVKFNIEASLPNANKIYEISIFRVVTNNGIRDLKEDKPKTGDYSPDYMFPKDEYKTDKTKITIGMPALKPKKNFDILILRHGLSDNKYKLLADLNEMLITQPIILDANGIIIASNEMTSTFNDLKSQADYSVGMPVPNEVFFTGLTKLYNKITQPAAVYYQNATNSRNLLTTNFLSQGYVNSISLGVPELSRRFNDIHYLEKIDKTGSFEKIEFGYLTADGNIFQKETKPFDIQQRIENLKKSSLYFDTLYQSLNELVIKGRAVYESIRDEAETILHVLDSNQQYLTKQLTEINKIIDKEASEAYWISGNTEFKDLQTKGKSLLTLDLGIANIWTNDLNNKSTYIPKVYYGVNIYFRGIDKKIKRSALLRSIPQKKGEHRYLLAEKTPWQRLSLTAGFTIGSLDKTNFDNFFGGSSLLIGPGYLLTNAFKISTGVCFLKRSKLNPLITEKSITTGYFITASLDIDLIEHLSKVTGIFTK